MIPPPEAEDNYIVYGYIPQYLLSDRPAVTEYARTAFDNYVNGKYLQRVTGTLIYIDTVAQPGEAEMHAIRIVAAVRSLN